MNAMKKQATMGSPDQNKDEMEMMIDMMTDQAKVEDEFYLKEGVHNDELEESIMHFMHTDDPDIKKAMAAYMMDMQKEVQKLGGPGGMPGGPGGMPGM